MGVSIVVDLFNARLRLQPILAFVLLQNSGYSASGSRLSDLTPSFDKTHPPSGRFDNRLQRKTGVPMDNGGRIAGALAVLDLNGEVHLLAGGVRVDFGSQ